MNRAMRTRWQGELKRVDWIGEVVARHVKAWPSDEGGVKDRSLFGDLSLPEALSVHPGCKTADPFTGAACPLVP